MKYASIDTIYFNTILDNKYACLYTYLYSSENNSIHPSQKGFLSDDEDVITYSWQAAFLWIMMRCRAYTAHNLSLSRSEMHSGS